MEVIITRFQIFHDLIYDAMMRIRVILKFLLALLVLLAVGATGFRIYDSRRTQRRFPVEKPFLVTGSESGEGAGPYVLNDGAQIVVLRNQGNGIHLNLNCSKSWNRQKVDITFETEDKLLGKTGFRLGRWGESFTFEPATLGSASFLKVRFHFDKKNTGDVKLNRCLVRTNRKYPKFFIFGLDGLSWRILNPLLKAKKLPNFQRLINEGASGTLVSEDPSYSPVIWTTIATGRTPREHGVTFFVARRRPEASTSIRAKRFWDILSEHSKLSSLITGWYLTWPVDRLNGGMLSDRSIYINKRHDLFYPSDTFDPVYAEEWSRVNEDLDSRLRRFTSFRYYWDFQKRFAPGTEERILSEQVHERLVQGYRRDESLDQAGFKLLLTLDPDVFALYLRGADYTSHGFWKYMDPESVPFFPVTEQERKLFEHVIDNYYIYLDEVLGKYLQIAGEDTTIFVLSDHGFHPIAKIVPEHPLLSGDHEKEGVIFCKGPAFRPGYAIQNASIYDFLPTLLYLTGLPPARDMRGNVWTEAMNPEYVRVHPVRRITSYGWRKTPGAEEPPESNVDEEIKQELRSLGYIN